MQISLNFMPAFFTKHAGLRYGESYYFDPEYRGRVECEEARFLHEALGRYGVGEARPQPSGNLFIQPVDLVMRTQGAEWKMPPDATLESWGKPWANLAPAEIARLDATAAARHSVIEAILEQYRAMQKLYGDKADIFGMKSGTMNIHTPFTTAHQLCGEALFVLLLTEPVEARRILDKVWEIYRAIFDRLGRATGATFNRIQLGDCSASLLSEDAYRAVVLPMNRAIASEFGRVGYHSCGSSSHLVEAFATLPRLDAIELGAGTDLAKGVRLMPKTAMRPLVDPTLMRQGDAGAVRSAVLKIVEATRPAPETLLCAWSFDRDTPLSNVEMLYKTVSEKRS
ncbi:MAG: hypothetical protein HY343_04015 [Lentisphaerae bacterium]|nr:hypothetical protein [Lentisphaerota bacterium]